MMKLKAKQWVVITGASKGLGEEFARQLAAKGLNLILVARSEDKLKILANELINKHGIDIDVYPINLKDDVAVLVLIKNFLKQTARPIDLLINNAGLGYYSDFWNQSDQQLQEMLLVNINALIRLTRAVLPSMLARHAGGILNIGSIAGFQPVPGFAVYAATKAFVINFGEALSFECRGTGVQVTTFCPGPTATHFGEVSNAPKRLFRNAARVRIVVSKALKAFESGRTLKWESWTEAFLNQSIRFSPRKWVVRISAFITRN